MPGTVAIPIRRVTVHRDGAVVVRQGPAAITEGEIVVGGLPLSLRRDSVHVSVHGAQVSAVRLSVEIPEGPAPPPATPQAEIGEAEDRMRRVEATIAALQAERQAAVKLAPGFDPAEPPPSPQRMRRWTEIEEFLGPWIEEIDEALREAREEREQLSRELDSYSELPPHEVEAAYWESWVPTLQALIEVEGEGEVQVELSYRVLGARWSPAYVVDADAALAKARFVMRASLAQVTGEDWSGVKLSLSTGSSRRKLGLPPLHPFRMGAPPPRPRPGWRELPSDFDALFDTTAPPPPGVGLEHRRVSTWSEQDLGVAPEGLGPPGEDDPWDVEGLVDEEIVEILPAGQELDDELTLPSGAAGRIPRRHHVGEPLTDLSDLVDEEPSGLGMPEIREMPPLDDPSTDMSPDAQETAITGSSPAPFSTVGAPLHPVGASRIDVEADEPEPTPPRALTPIGLERRPAARPPGIEVDPSLLDYARLQLGSFRSAPQERGRLLPLTDAEALESADLPSEAVDRLAWWQRESSGRARDLRRRELPPLHRPPHPIDEVDLTFEAEGELDVPSDGRSRWVVVLTEEIDIEVRYAAVPRNDLRVYRRLRAKLTGSKGEAAAGPARGPLLAGPVQVFVEGRLEATVPWAGTGSEEPTVELALGAEDRLTLTRDVKYREESVEGPAGARRFHTIVDVRVASALPRDVRVQLVERVPVPENAAGPEVEIETSTPAARPYLGEPGGPPLQGAKVQVVDVPPQGEARAVLGYAIGLRTGEELAGGERRG